MTTDSDIIYGLHAVREALEAGTVNRLLIQKDLRGKNVDDIKSLAQKQAVKVDWAEKTTLSNLTEAGVHQGFVAYVAAFAYEKLESLLSNLTGRETATILILDELSDPHNLGAIARTADATGVDALIIPKHRSVGITPAAVKASTGAFEHVPVVRVINLAQTLETLKTQGFWIFGTDMTGTPYTTWNSTGKIALIIGSEGRGISQGLKKQVDEMITLPMVGHVQSLNASVAASILMYKILENKK
ncbi:MAG: 23S rRNA (guanosine(2251)-2'-O)-methyltransferase RlmB [Streptococcaceae bacterium]|jgi:23S rRNA (guanosine2251-2'-O)-methyltransferase|nr:23S rRNA (guanosine(2251)-2'-O)-methyltransferase RlmB [Streptococcaceae bacterium]